MMVQHRCSSCGKELPSEYSKEPNYLCSRCMNNADPKIISKNKKQLGKQLKESLEDGNEPELVAEMFKVPIETVNKILNSITDFGEGKQV